MTNWLLKGMLAGAMILPASFQQANANVLPGELDSYVTVVSEYSFRGVSQADEGAAIQGGIDWTGDSGLYAGVWGSSVDFNDGDEANVEFDIYTGYSFEPIDNLTVDIGGIYYAYPGADSSLDYDFFEVYGSLGFDFDVLNVSAGLNYSPEYFGDSGDATYYFAGVEVPLAKAFTLSGRYGYQTIDDNTTFGLPDYADWEIGLSYDYQDLTFQVSYIDTDLDTNECANGCDSRVMFGVSASF